MKKAVCLTGQLFRLWLAVLVTASAFLPAKAAQQPAKGGKKQLTKDFFADAKVRTFQIEIPEAGLMSLRRYPRTNVQVTVREGSLVLSNVALHLKGMGSFRTIDEKPSFAIKFDEYNSDQEYLGLTKLMFNNSVQDPTYVAELLATGLFRDAGVPAARVTHAQVQLNGTNLGLYVVIEAMNKRFLKQHFKSAKGNLYEGYVRDIDSRLELDNGDSPGQQDVREVVAACAIPEPKERLQTVSKLLDVDKFISFVAMEVLVGHWDGYAIHTNNYRLYHDPTTDKMVFITHGLDWAFRRPNISIDPPLKSLVGRAVLDTTEGRKHFRERIGQLYTNVFRLEVLTNRLDDAMRKLRASGLEPATLAKIERKAGIMRERIQLRSLRVAEQLAGIKPAPLQFDNNGAARLDGWRDESDRGEPVMDEVKREGRRTLHIQAAGGRSRGSWRTQVYLTRGHYQFTGTAMVQGLTGGSTGLRISGGQRSSGISGSGSWRPLSHTFEVTDDGVDVEFVCDFYGLAGEVWFDLDSLQVRRL